jgi:quercetin dioxygenase-like cupin family protein
MTGDRQTSAFRVEFDRMPWQQIRPDVRQKIYCEGSRQLRLVEFDTSDGAEGWCEAGHIGYVLKGSLSISFAGEVIAFRAGDGLFIPSGDATRHRSVEIAAGTQLLMVEDIA